MRWPYVQYKDSQGGWFGYGLLPKIQNASLIKAGDGAANGINLEISENGEDSDL